MICSSNPGMNCPEPILRLNFSAFPPSNATPSTKPSKSISVISPSFTALFLFIFSNGAFCEAISLSFSSTSFAVAVGFLNVGTAFSYPSAFTSGLKESSSSTSILSSFLSYFLKIGSPMMSAALIPASAIPISISALSASDSASCLSLSP